VERRQSCAWRSRRGRAERTAEEPCVCRRFASESFSFVLSRSSLPGLTRQIHADLALTQCFPPALALLQLSMDHRHRCPKDAVLRTAMPGGDESESAVTVLGTARMRRRIARTKCHFHLSPVGRGRANVVSEGEGGLSSSFKLSTRSPQPSPHWGEGAVRAARTNFTGVIPPRLGSVPLPPTA
jgi:hypothetical protein